MSQLHIDILLAMRSAKPLALTSDLVLTDMRRLRHPSLTLPQVETALRDLADKRLIAALESPLSNRWRITALGDSALQEERL